MFLGADGHDFIYDRPNECEVLRQFDWILCNNTIVKNKEIPQTICVKTDFLSKYTELLEKLDTGNFALITCSSKFSPIYKFPSETRRILANPYLRAWFSENNTGVITKQTDNKDASRVLDVAADDYNLRKFYSIPAGLNFHDRRKKIAAENIIKKIQLENGGLEKIIENKISSTTTAPRIMYCRKNTAADDTQDEYYKTFCGITRNLNTDFYPWVETIHTFAPLYKPLDDSESSMENYYRELSTAHFLLCPSDSTIDPFPIVWEALALGVIPILLENPFTVEMYRGFPIYFVELWNECVSSSPIFYKNKYYNLMSENIEWSRKLETDFWIQKINSAIQMPVLFVPPNLNTEMPALPIHNIEDMYSEYVENPQAVAFSFCIYGKNKMYYLGLRDNIIQIKKYFNQISYPRNLYSIYIFVGQSADFNLLSEVLYESRYGQYYSDIKLYFTNCDGVINMIYRYAPITIEPTPFSHIFIRDADSVIGERDLYCIFDFLRTAPKNATAHVIRDHYYHKSKLTGGLSCITKLGANAVASILREKMSNFSSGDHSIYGADETFLNNTLYDLLKAAGQIVVHSNLCEYAGELRKPILCRNTLTNFCGNVLQKEPFPHFQFLYNNIDIHEHYKWCKANSVPPILFIQTIISFNVWRDFSDAEFLCSGDIMHMKELLYGGIMQLPYSARSKTIVYLIECFLDLEKYEHVMMCYELYAYCEVDEVAKTTLFARFLRESKKKIYLMTEGVTAVLNKDIIAIVYGNYPDDWRAYPSRNVIYRNVWFYEKDKELFVYSDWNTESDRCMLVPSKWKETEGWENIGAIFIMGLKSAPDRIYNTMLELTRMGVRLDKVYIYKANKDETLKNAYLGATKNHLDCLEMAKSITKNGKAVLFLEDDFVFSQSYQMTSMALCDLFEEVPIESYDVCFLAYSKLHERAKWSTEVTSTQKYLDLESQFIESRQYCTTSSGYLIPHTSINKVYEIVKEGYDKLAETGDSASYCIDRYWTKLQDANRMILFKQKLGFQRPSISKITGELNIMLD